METLQSKGKSSQNPTVLFRKTVNESLKSRDLPDLDEEEELEEEEAEEIESGLPVNIFDFCHELMEKGEIVSYEIYKHSTFMARKPHPFSWEEIQEEFGEGHYRVIARSERTKKYVKQETRFVGKPVKKENEKTIQETIREAIPKEPKRDPFEDMAKMATLMKSLTPPVPQPAPDQTPAMMMQFMQTMMSLQQDAQKTTLEMIKEMQKSNQAMIDKLDRNQKEAMEKIEARLAAEDGGKKKGYDPMQLLQLVQGAEKRGFENYLLLEELAEKKAARMASGESDEEESATGKMIKTILPTVAAALSKQPQQPQMQRPVIPPRVPARPMPRPMPQAQASPKAPQATASAPVQQPSQAQNAQPKPVSVLPKANTVPANGAVKPTATIGGNKTQTVEVKSAPKPVAPTKDQVLEAIMMPLGMQLMRADEVQLEPTKLKQTKVDAANETIGIVTKMGVSPTQLLQMVSKNDMLDIAKSVGLPLHANAWLEDYYAHLEQIAAKSHQAGSKESQNP